MMHRKRLNSSEQDAASSASFKPGSFGYNPESDSFIGKSFQQARSSPSSPRVDNSKVGSKILEAEQKSYKYKQRKNHQLFLRRSFSEDSPLSSPPKLPGMRSATSPVKDLLLQNQGQDSKSRPSPIVTYKESDQLTLLAMRREYSLMLQDFPSTHELAGLKSVFEYKYKHANRSQNKRPTKTLVIHPFSLSTHESSNLVIEAKETVRVQMDLLLESEFERVAAEAGLQAMSTGTGSTGTSTSTSTNNSPINSNNSSKNNSRRSSPINIAGVEEPGLDIDNKIRSPTNKHWPAFADVSASTR